MERKHKMVKKNQYELIENSVIDDGVETHALGHTNA